MVRAYLEYRSRNAQEPRTNAENERSLAKNLGDIRDRRLQRPSGCLPKPGCTVDLAKGDSSWTPPSHAAIDRLGDEIAELSAHLDAATARLLDLIREFDAREGWNNGFSSCAAWLSWRVGYAPGAAREHVRVARALGTLPLLSQALARGELSYAKVRELTRVATPETEETTVGGGPRRHRRTCRADRAWLAPDGPQGRGQEAARHHAARALHVYQDEDGAVRIRGRLAPEVGAVLLKALEAARESLYQQRHDEAPDADPPTMEQQQADALALLAETALHQGIDPGAPGERYQVVVHVDAAVLVDADQAGQSVLEGGMRVPAGTSQRLACDATRVVMRHDAEGRVIEVGARTRTIPPALRRALQHRDHGCRFPGCGVRFGQGHHIRHWAHGGPTTLSNLTMLCRRHHRAVHEEGYQVERQPDGELRFRRPNGWTSQKCRHLPIYRRIPRPSSARGTRRMDARCTRARRCRAGRVSAWTSATLSTCCIRGRGRTATGGSCRVKPAKSR